MRTIHPYEGQIPLKVVSCDGEEHELPDCGVSILWPWDILTWLWESNNFLQWADDDPTTRGVKARASEYWNNCVGLDFYHRLGMQPADHDTTIPVYFHADGVRIYKAQKAWVYSMSSACRKGPSIKTKLVMVVLRENRMVRRATHDAVAILIAYACETLRSGRFPRTQQNGQAFPAGSVAAQRAGQRFAGGWKLAFAGFKGDWEARVVVHKSKRSYNSINICDHCLASRVSQFTFGDFRMDANCLNHRFTHEEYMILQGAQQSAWRFVRGWTKDRNLEDP